MRANNIIYLHNYYELGVIMKYYYYLDRDSHSIIILNKYDWEESKDYNASLDILKTGLG